MELKSLNDFSKINEDKLTLVDFFATWCGPCKMLSPIVENIAKKFESKINVIKVNIDEFNELAAQYQIQSVPTIIFFKSGNEVHKSIGFCDEQKLTSMIEQLL